MTSSANIRLVAKVVGQPVVGVIAILGLLGIAYSPIPDWLKGLAILVLACPIVGIAIRWWIGGGEGGTDVEVALGESRITISGIPPFVVGQALSRIIAIFKRDPIPRPRGVVRGNPAQEGNAEILVNATLPENVIITEESVPIPTDSASSSPINVANTENNKS